MRLARWSIGLALAALAAGAAAVLGRDDLMRPEPMACPVLPLAPPGDPEPGLMTADAMVGKAVMARMGAAAEEGPVTLHVITLSAGGQWGAFGAGLLTGWSQNAVEPRPEFDVVTGVSAGAILAPVVFAGPEHDGAMAFYRGLARQDVLVSRRLRALLGAPSLASVAPLEAVVAERVGGALMARVAERHGEGAQLLISAVNLDTTRLEVLDLGASAASDRPARARAGCLREAMLASAAIPGLMPPRHINDALYVDGGLREQVFLRAVDEAVARAEAETGREVRVEAYVVVNGSLDPPVAAVRDRLFDYLGRSVVTLADEVLRDSIVEAVDLAAARPGWRVRGIVPRIDLSACAFDEVPAATFDPCLTEILFDAGLEMGRAAPIAWMDGAALRAAAEAL